MSDSKNLSKYSCDRQAEPGVWPVDHGHQLFVNLNRIAVPLQAYIELSEALEDFPPLVPLNRVPVASVLSGLVSPPRSRPQPAAAPSTLGRTESSSTASTC